jgi:hypothetical protein
MMASHFKQWQNCIIRVALIIHQFRLFQKSSADEFTESGSDHTSVLFVQAVGDLTLSLLMSYIYIYIYIYGAPCKARHFNVVYIYIWTYV